MWDKASEGLKKFLPTTPRENLYSFIEPAF